MLNHFQISNVTCTTDCVLIFYTELLSSECLSHRPIPVIRRTSVKQMHWVLPKRVARTSIIWGGGGERGKEHSRGKEVKNRYFCHFYAEIVTFVFFFEGGVWRDKFPHAPRWRHHCCLRISCCGTGHQRIAFLIHLGLHENNIKQNEIPHSNYRTIRTVNRHSI